MFGAPNGKRRAQALPIARPGYVSQRDRDRDTRRPSLRIGFKRILARRATRYAVLGLAVVSLLLWLISGRDGHQQRLGGGPRVVARDWSAPIDSISNTAGQPNATILVRSPGV